MRTPDVVFDTNVVVSALLFGAGRLAWLRAAWANGGAVPLVSAETTRELLRVLAYPKYGLSASEREDLLGDYLPFTRVVDVPADLDGLPDCRDPFDRPFLRLAVAGRADYLVTGDGDLLAIGRVKSCRVLSPEECRGRFLPRREAPPASDRSGGFSVRESRATYRTRSPRTRRQ